MKYEKAKVTIIDLGEDEIIRCSGCTTTGFQNQDTCTGGNHKDKFSGCTNTGHRDHGGQ